MPVFDQPYNFKSVFLWSNRISYNSLGAGCLLSCHGKEPLLNDAIPPDLFLSQAEQSKLSVDVHEFLVLVRKIHLPEETGLKN